MANDPPALSREPAAARLTLPPGRRRRWLLAAIAVVAVFAAVLGLFNWFVALQNRNVSSGIAVGAAAPDFSLPDQNGRRQSLHGLMGPKGLLLVFVRSADW